MIIKLFSGASGSTTSDSFIVLEHEENPGAIIVGGTLTAGSVTIQAEDPQDEGSWVDLNDLVWTSVGGYSISLPAGLNLRAALVGVTGSVNLTIV